jgi:hypothetical protein
VSELTHPHVAEEQTTTTALSGEPTPSFPELIYAHYAWWKEVHAGKLTERTQHRYQKLKERFESAYGPIVRAYWAANVESAVVLTEKPRRPSWLEPRIAFHRESEWATRHWPDISTELHRCDELAVKATTVLTGVRRRICMNLVMASAEHLMGLADRRADPAVTTQDDGKLLREEQAALARAESYYKEAANGQAQIVYFGGMAMVLVVIATVAAVWLAISWTLPIAALLAGALGAVVSVVARINAGQFDLDYDVGRPYALFLGGLRPLIGGAFATALCFALEGHLVQFSLTENDSQSHHRLALMVIGFVAGFSERWAQDTLVAAVPGSGKETKKQPAAAPAATRQHDLPPAQPVATDGAQAEAVGP